MADYREHHPEIRSAGASIVAISVDAPEKSEALRTQFSLPFPILCDTDHRVVKDWGIYNAEEKGGIAKPSVFIIDPGRLVRYAAVNTVNAVVRRVYAAEIVAVLQHGSPGQPVRRKAYFPLFSDWKSAFRNVIKR